MMDAKARAWLTWWKLAGCPKYVSEEKLLAVPKEAFAMARDRHGPELHWWGSGFGCRLEDGTAILYACRDGEYGVHIVESQEKQPPPRYFAKLAQAKYIVAWALREGELL